MSKRVAVIASGETERRAVPHFVQHLEAEGIDVVEVRIPPANNRLTVEMAEKLVKAAWYSRLPDERPQKFVILCDVDGKDPNDVLRPFRDKLPQRVREKIPASLVFAFAQWHLEAWYFADAANLRAYLNRDLGQVNTSDPDTIQNPKNCLKQLLGERAYTAVVAEEIARTLDPQTMMRSSSFSGFLAAVRNGGAAASAQSGN